MEHEIACIVTNDFFYIQLKKSLHSERYPLSCMRSDHPLLVSPHYLIDKDIRPARLRKGLKDAIIRKKDLQG